MSIVKQDAVNVKQEVFDKIQEYIKKNSVEELMMTFENFLREQKYWSDVEPKYSDFDGIDIWTLSSILNGNYRIIKSLEKELEKEYLRLYNIASPTTPEGTQNIYRLKGFEQALRIIERDRGIEFSFKKQHNF